MLIAGICYLSVTSVTADTYRWKDKEGKVHYGAAVPAEYADQPYDVLNSAGVVIDHIEDTSVPLEVIVEEKVKERAPLISDEERQRQADRRIFAQHVAEQLRRLRQPTCVVAALGIDLVDQVRHLFRPLQLQRIDHRQIHLISVLGCGVPSRAVSWPMLHA